MDANDVLLFLFAVGVFCLALFIRSYKIKTYQDKQRQGIRNQQQREFAANNKIKVKNGRTMSELEIGGFHPTVRLVFEDNDKQAPVYAAFAVDYESKTIAFAGSKDSYETRTFLQLNGCEIKEVREFSRMVDEINVGLKKAAAKTDVAKTDEAKKAAEKTDEAKKAAAKTDAAKKAAAKTDVRESDALKNDFMKKETAGDEGQPDAGKASVSARPDVEGWMEGATLRVSSLQVVLYTGRLMDPPVVLELLGKPRYTDYDRYDEARRFASAVWKESHKIISEKVLG